MWESTFQTFLQRPIFGFGESQFKVVVPAALNQYNHPHNSILQFMLQWGLVGVACLAVLTAPILWKVVQLSRQRPDESLPAFFVLAGLLIFSLYEGSLYHVYPVMMVVVALCFVLGKSESRINGGK